MTLFLFSLAFVQITKMQIYLKCSELGFYIRKFISYDINRYTATVHMSM